ncbi:MAG: VIT1/CCC1 transporter family protein [Candidatus Hermodarchaeota archaeon]
MNRIREYSQMTGVWSLSRRYAVIGAFDGVLTILGMVVGAYFGHMQTGHLETLDIPLLVTAGVAAAFALGISSGWGAFEAEIAENIVEFKEIEHMMVRELNGTIREHAKRFATIVSSLVHGIAPIPAGIIPLVPLVFLEGINALYMSVILSMMVLFLIGIFLGYVSKRNLLYCGFRMILAGIVTAFVSILLGASH